MNACAGQTTQRSLQRELRKPLYRQAQIALNTVFRAPATQRRGRKSQLLVVFFASTARLFIFHTTTAASKQQGAHAASQPRTLLLSSFSLSPPCSQSLPPPSLSTLFCHRGLPRTGLSDTAEDDEVAFFFFRAPRGAGVAMPPPSGGGPRGPRLLLALDRTTTTTRTGRGTAATGAPHPADDQPAVPVAVGRGGRGGSKQPPPQGAGGTHALGCPLRSRQLARALPPPLAAQKKPKPKNKQQRRGPPEGGGRGRPLVRLSARLKA